MSEWKSYLLGDLVEVNPSSINKNYPYSDIQYLDIASVGSNTYNGTTAYLLSEAPSRAKRLVQNDDTIISTVRPNLRSFLKIKNLPANLVVSTGFAVLRPTDKIDSDFLFYTISSFKFTQYLSAIADSKTTSYPAVDTDAFKNAEIYMPDITTQRKIATILSAYDDLIKNNNQRIAILEEIAQRLYREWFVHFRFPGHENVKMVELKLGRIPEDWEYGTIGDISEKIISGGTPQTNIDAYWNGDIPWFSSGETRDSFIISTEKRISEAGVSNSSTRLANKHDVVIASAGQGRTRGQTSMLLIDTYINQSTIAITGKDNYSEFLFYNLSSRYEELRNASDANSIRGSITTKLINGLGILIPKRNIVREYSLLIKPIVTMVENVLRRNESLSKTRDLLLPRLISGDLDVSALDILINEEVLT